MAASATPGSIRKISRRSPNRSGQRTPSAALEAVGSRPRRAQRRPTKQASYELANHAKAYLEGSQFASGYDFLYSLLAAGTSISTPAQPYIGFLAPPAYIALASSLIAYPHVTTKSRSNDATKGSDAALRYLQCVHCTIDGPAYPTIRKAFTFPEERSRRRVPGNRAAAASLSPEAGGDVERIAGAAANAQSLWYRAEDFWHIVGWAFNCSIAHKKRWSRWKLWLNISVDFLEADWDVCVKQSKGNEKGGESILQESLLWRYIVGEAESTNRGMRRRIVKAILALATTESRKEYPEVWETETAEPKRKRESNQPLGEVDFETGAVGDYDSDEEMEDAVEQMDDVKSGSSPRVPSDDDIQTVHDAVERLGGQGAIELRQRLIALLAQVAQALPAQFTTLSDFFDNILEDFIHLPTIVFKVLLSTLEMPALFQVAFNANLLLPLVSRTLPDYFRYEPRQEDFEATLLPLKGTTQSYAANAKISLILEQMVMYMMACDALTPTEPLRQAMETGIEARQGVFGTGRGKRGNLREEKQAQGLMEASSERLLGLLEVLEISAGKPPQLPKEESKTGANPAMLSFGSGSSLSPAPDSDTDLDE
ncbi:uncharacterized protein K460DRAFT_284565 [Cucurbitaria berberidis CBS 394.84]|uniref:Uncharacterized protein n=1 Tax=Cucurbitaria berberidis CBS 394.84 TaxID=1168544 RepID=A0A9P4GGV9_9PLEO|nr:uncharacterized protein K460DRAFT_284565 [Cucurbitaria berberidis CBS 394.84]KAF1845004.1 hypothetical protein K460DRAFT_284565 [Cucurbitaria berberidis CBS 394.84]